MSVSCVMVTGASGFIGRSFVERLSSEGLRINCPLRSARDLPPNAYGYPIPSLSEDADWSLPLEGSSVVVHLAARVHVMSDVSSNPNAAYRSMNVDATLNLARQAAKNGIRRFIYMSSVKACGEHSDPGYPISPLTDMNPLDAYGVSKMEAEKGLHRIADETGMEVVIIRSPLVYGPGVRANFASLIRLINWGIPLPLGAVQDNRRSFVGISNLVDFLRVCIDHPAAANRTFMVSDGDDMSTRTLISRLANAMGRPIRLINVPVSCLRVFCKLFGRGDVFDRLTGNLQVDITDNFSILGWNPPTSVDEGFSMLMDDGRI